MHEAASPALVGRERLLAELTELVGRVAAGQRVTVLVTGEAGIGKTSLLRAAAEQAAAGGARIAWGTCLDLDAAPGFWPWTQALEGLLRTLGPAGADVLDEDAGWVATIAPSAGEATTSEGSERDRLLAMDATRRLIESAATTRPVLVILDDLQWADASTLDLLELVSHSPTQVGLGVIGAYRDDDLTSPARHRLVSLAARTEHLRVDGLSVDAVRALIERTTRAPVPPEAAARAHQRTGGHPFFVRELALLGLDADDGRVPTAVREAIDRRLSTLPRPAVTVLEAAAVAGPVLVPDVLGTALGASQAAVDDALRSGFDAGILVGRADEPRFAHDLLRETLQGRVDAARRPPLHLALGDALDDRATRGGAVSPADVARHFLAAASLDGPHRAVEWALAAHRADRALLAFTEAAGHLRRLRTGLAAAGVDLADGVLVDVLVNEADALARSGATVDARGLLRHAAEVAERAGPEAIARVALATVQLGARFATRRDELINQLEHTLDAVAGLDDALEARVTAALARELQHSVAEERHRAGPLSERALVLGRRSGSTATLLDGLLARHDVLWEPGGGESRADIAQEIVDVAVATGDHERQADGLLLLANALLEQGSPAFESALESCFAVLDELGQPRHRYTALTRRACMALIRHRLDEAEALIEEAKALGDRILEPDAGNVYMSQRLELVRARADAEELADFADAAVAHWTGAPVHAHAVAAGFLARAGDTEAAERHVTTVLDLGTWRADRSYLWSVFVRELAHAAAAIGNRSLSAELLDDLRPVTSSCGVNGAVVAFAGSHAHPASLLADVLGDHEGAALLREQATAAHRRLGARGWSTEAWRPPARMATVDVSEASMLRRGPIWLVTFAGREVSVPHSKGLADISQLVATPGRDVHVLDLFDPPVRSADAGELVDRRALAAYRQRLADLDSDIDDAEMAHDDERRARAEVERQALVAEVARATRVGGRPRQFANHPTERARKAVTARVRDAMRKLEGLFPELAVHLQQTIVTGTYCRYRGETVQWRVDRD